MIGLVLVVIDDRRTLRDENYVFSSGRAPKLLIKSMFLYFYVRGFIMSHTMHYHMAWYQHERHEVSQHEMSQHMFAYKQPSVLAGSNSFSHAFSYSSSLNSFSMLFASIISSISFLSIIISSFLLLRILIK